MSDTVIKVENLGKKYIISHQQRESYTALRDVLANKARMVGNRVCPAPRALLFALCSLRPALCALLLDEAEVDTIQQIIRAVD